MHVVVAGSSGLIGSALVAALREADHEVTRLVRRDPRAADERRWDPPAGSLPAGALDGVGAVVNLCGVGIGAKRWTDSYKREIRDSRLEPTELLAQSCVDARVPSLLNASAVGYYGDTGDRVVDETAPPGSGHLAELCRSWEAATAAASQGGVRVVLMRTGLVLSAKGGLMSRLRPIFRIGAGGRLGDGSQYMPWISLDDEIGAIRFLIEHPEVSGPVNLTGPAPVTNTEFTKQLGKAAHRPAVLPVPAFALKIALGEFAEEGALTGQRAAPAVLQDAGYAFEHPELRAALAVPGVT